jgi:cysteine synthase B
MDKMLEDYVGDTPLVRLQRLPGTAGEARGNRILAKLEGNNPAGFGQGSPRAVDDFARRKAGRYQAG